MPQILLPANLEHTELNENASGTLRLNDCITADVSTVFCLCQPLKI